MDDNQVNNPCATYLAVFAGSVVDYITFKNLGKWLYHGLVINGFLVGISMGYTWFYYATRLSLYIPHVPTPDNWYSGSDIYVVAMVVVGSWFFGNILARLIRAGLNVIEYKRELNGINGPFDAQLATDICVKYRGRA